MNRSRSNKGLAERETDKHRAFEVERHSIDFVPLAERYGTPSRLFTIFFSTNFMIVGVAVGTLGITAGLGLWWVMAGLAIGNAIGTVFTAAHSAQGPHLGIPQMIQSRAQFGVLGAGLPLVAVIITYVLYTAANGLLVEGTLNSIAPLGATRALILFGTVTVAVAFMGYELIHRLGATLTVLSGLLFVAAAWLFLTQGTGFVSLGGATAEHFNRTLFLVTITQAAAWCLSYGPIVADYSRYLPPTVKTSTTFWYSGLGIFFGATLVMIAGAYLASRSLEFAKDPGRAVAAAFGGARPIASTIIALGVLESSIMNLYSGYMATMTIFTGLHRMIRIGRAMKLVVLCALMVVSTLVAVLAQKNFEIYFGDILSAMIYLLVPWSAINLVDYYLIRRGEYVIADLYRVDGRYGAFRWNTIAVYLLGIAAQVPFMNLSFYKGVAAARLGWDFAWLAGLLIPASLYMLVESVTQTQSSAHAPTRERHKTKVL